MGLLEISGSGYRGLRELIVMPCDARPRRIHADSGRPVSHVGLARQSVRCTLAFDHGFAITRTDRGAIVQIWQGKDSGDYHASAVGNGVIDVTTSPLVATQVAIGHLGVVLPWLGLALAVGVLSGLAAMVVRVRSLNPHSRIGD